MKTKSDPRHRQREYKIKALFTFSFRNENADQSIKEVVDNLVQIDKYIAEVAPEWPIDRLNKIDLAILRLSVYELMIDTQIPPKVVIDEAVELGKEYGSDNTAKFVNGVLGSLLKKRTENQ